LYTSKNICSIERVRLYAATIIRVDDASRTATIALIPAANLAH